jgi:hypothetical protein
MFQKIKLKLFVKLSSLSNVGRSSSKEARVDLPQTTELNSLTINGRLTYAVNLSRRCFSF